MRKIVIDGLSGTIVQDSNAAWDIVQIMAQWDAETWAWWARHMADRGQIDRGASALGVAADERGTCKKNLQLAVAR